MTAPTSAFSAPGKALVAGGYLVLFPEYSALSVGLESRMHAVVYADSDSQSLEIHSPQFVSQWEYPAKQGTHPNPFLAACYDTVSTYYAFPITGKIAIWSDAGFHSQAEAEQDHFEGGLKGFSYHGRPITEVAKTGLGSSAALVVVVCAALVKLARRDTQTELDTTLVHNLAQVAHCVAQRKVGSGFDVATAVYGTIIYSRFSPHDIPSELETEPLRRAIDKKWEMTAKPISLAPNLEIIIGDIAQGSETPGMVKQVLQWRDRNPEESDALFDKLQTANMALAAVLQDSTAAPYHITNAIYDVRRLLQKLTQLSGAPIEPQRQTDLLEAASQVPGVLGGVVPGAGGEDAVCLLVDTSQASVDTILSGLRQLKGFDVTWMHLAIMNSGLRSEPADPYASFHI